MQFFLTREYRPFGDLSTISSSSLLDSRIDIPDGVDRWRSRVASRPSAGAGPQGVRALLEARLCCVKAPLVVRVATFDHHSPRARREQV